MEIRFTCHVSFDVRFPQRLQWDMKLHESLSEPEIQVFFIPSDKVGHIQINRDIFVFNLTSNNDSGLESTVTLMLDSNSSSSFINLGAVIVVQCSQGNISGSAQHAVLQLVYDGKN